MKNPQEKKLDVAEMGMLKLESQSSTEEGTKELDGHRKFEIYPRKLHRMREEEEEEYVGKRLTVTVVQWGEGKENRRAAGWTLDSIKHCEDMQYGAAWR